MSESLGEVQIPEEAKQGAIALVSDQMGEHTKRIGLEMGDHKHHGILAQQI